MLDNRKQMIRLASANSVLSMLWQLEVNTKNSLGW